MTDEQIDILVKGIYSWKKADAAPGAPLYSSPPGNAATGAQTYTAYLEALKKIADPGLFKDGFLTNAAFLGLSSDQYLRTLIVAGRPELGIPDYQNAIAGQPLTDQQISDIVAWLISQRKNEFGHPLVPPPTATN